MPDRESEACVEREVTPRSFELVTSEGVAVRRNQSSVRRLPQRPQEQQLPGQAPEENSSDDPESRPHESDTPESREPESSTEQSGNEPSPPTPERPPICTSSRIRKPRDRWEPRWTSQLIRFKRGDVVVLTSYLCRHYYVIVRRHLTIMCFIPMKWRLTSQVALC